MEQYNAPAHWSTFTPRAQQTEGCTCIRNITRTHRVHVEWLALVLMWFMCMDFTLGELFTSVQKSSKNHWSCTRA